MLPRAFVAALVFYHRGVDSESIPPLGLPCRESMHPQYDVFVVRITILSGLIAGSGFDYSFPTPRGVGEGAAAGPQPADGATRAPKIKKEDGRLDWGLSQASPPLSAAGMC